MENPQQLKAVAHQRQPQRVLNTVIIMLERAAGVARRVNVDALDLAGELLFERFEGEQIVAKDEAVSKRSLSVTHCWA